MIPTYLIVLLMGVGVLTAYTGLLEPGQGFGLFFAGAALAALSAIGLAGAAALASALGKTWRRSALVGAIVPLIATLWVVGGRMLNPVPTINDITTDTADPPGFTASEAATQVYETAFEPQQRAAYPDVQPVLVPEPPDAAFDRALAVAQTMPGWEVVVADKQNGRIEAVATSSIFRFRDDVSIRLRSEGDGTRMDIRSRSRVGRSDLGANAARILAFQESLQTGVAAR
jgi:uncharacterized protein (DUF1499 family)